MVALSRATQPPIASHQSPRAESLRSRLFSLAFKALSDLALPPVALMYIPFPKAPCALAQYFSKCGPGATGFRVIWKCFCICDPVVWHSHYERSKNLQAPATPKFPLLLDSTM